MGLLHDIIDAMQTIHAGVAGVTWAPALADYPASINNAQLPFVMTWPSASIWDEAAIGVHRHLVGLQVTVIFEAVGTAGYRPATLITAVDLLDGLSEVYLDYANIATLSGTVEQISEISVSALREVIYAGISYYGVQFEFQATVKGTIQ